MKKRPLIIGITGGIGSGKSTLTKSLNTYWPSISADEVVKSLYATNYHVQDELKKLFGEQVIVGGAVDKDLIVAKCFISNDDTFDEIERKNAKWVQLGKMLEPYVLQEMRHLTLNFPNANLIIWELPLLCEYGWKKYVDYVVVVECSKDTQIQRIKERNNWSDEKILSIMERQVSRETRRLEANILFNSNNGVDFEYEKLKIVRALEGWLTLKEVDGRNLL